MGRNLVINSIVYTDAVQRQMMDRQELRKKIMRTGISVLIIYISVAVILFLLQRRIIYYPMTLEKEYEFPPYVPGMSEIYITCEDGALIHGLWAEGKPGKACILIFHGNAGNITHRETLLQGFSSMGYSVLLIDYHGYGKSEGAPSEQNLYMDGRASVEWLEKKKNIAPEQTVIFAKSLGSGVGVEIALLHPVKGLILESPFSSTSSVARSHFPYSLFPTGLLIRDRYDNMKKIGNISCPLLIIHGDEDTIISQNESSRLFKKAEEPKTLYIVEGAGHNNVQFVKPVEYWKKLNKWIGKLE